MNILKMETSEVESAEKEASEVLHTLLSVERIEKSSQNNSVQQLVVVQGDDGKVQWHSPMQEPIYATFEQANYDQANETVVWEGTIALDIESINNQSQVLVDDGNIVESEPNNETDVPAEPKVVKKPVRKKYKKVFSVDERTIELENNVQDVRARFQLGCECNDDSCFRGLNPETVYRHRLNIAELTKEEHDMYLMGVTMACMSDPGVTVKRKERRRLRAHYVYQGRRVCLSAFLYLENCTLYQLKRIRKHIMTHGVTPRVHGNHGKKPHNVFSLDIYRRATNFLKSYIEHYTTSSGNLKSPVVLPSDISRKTIHNAYEIYIKAVAPQGEKVMGYSTFRHFMKEQFPHVRFCKSEPGAGSNNNHSNNGALKHSSFFSRATKSEQDSIPIGNSNITQVATIPLLLPDSSTQEPVSTPTFIVAPVQQIVQQDYSSFQPHTITVAPISNTFAFTTI